MKRGIGSHNARPILATLETSTSGLGELWHALALTEEGWPKVSPMSTASRVAPWRASRWAELLVLAMSSGTPIDGANMRATTRADAGE